MKMCFLSTHHPFLTLHSCCSSLGFLESQAPDKYTEKSYTLKGLLTLVGRYTLQTLGNLEPAGKGRVYMYALCQGSQNQRTESDP
jgi:hypothetical protein